MKTLIITLVCLFSIASVTQAQTAAADQEAIKKVIADETDGYFNRNKEQWANAWAHEPHLQWSANSSNGQVLLANSWEDYSAQMAAAFLNPPTAAAKVQRDNYQISLVGNAATATFLQSTQVGTYQGKSREVRVLEKQGNAWKLVYVNSRTVE